MLGCYTKFCKFQRGSILVHLCLINRSKCTRRAIPKHVVHVKLYFPAGLLTHCTPAIQATCCSEMASNNNTISTKSEENIKFPPLLCMTLRDAKRKSEYATTYSPKHRLIYPGIKLSPTFLYQSSRNFESQRPRQARLPGFVPRINTGALLDYNRPFPL
jgi:hypothetical protein